MDRNDNRESRHANSITDFKPQNMKKRCSVRLTTASY